jgi:putative Holliday junction resolvase
MMASKHHHLMMVRTVAALLIALLYYKPIGFAFAPPYYRQQTAPSSHTHAHIICQNTNQDLDDDDIILTTDKTSPPTTTLASPPSTEVDFSTLRSIGIDYGLSRTGIAITTGGYHPRPLAILSNYNQNSTTLSTQIVQYILSERATNIVLGLPLHKDGSNSEQSNITRTFGQILLQQVRQNCGPSINLTLWDERYTSKEAATRIKAEAIAKKERIPSASELDTTLDADAACIILEDYYKESGVDGEIVTLENEQMERECYDIYIQNMERQENIRRSLMEERERGRNARKEMIARVKALEEEEESSSGGVSQLKKKKKKKKKK